jgi:hypothetical protein
MESSIKSLTITGSAAEDAMKPRRSGSRKKRQQSAGDMESSVSNPEEDTQFIENAKRLVFGKQAAPAMITHIQPPVKAPVVPTPVASTPDAPVPEPIRPAEGGSVILKPPKQSRVKLQPKIVPAVTSAHSGSQTRKARRIKLTVANLTHRFTRAKRVRDDTEKKSGGAIRDFLVQKGVIQAKSKAPEKMLRSMYSDFMLLKDQAL